MVAVFTARGYNADATPSNTIMEKIVLTRLIEVWGRGIEAAAQR
jgi:hypothetical protein